MDEVAIRSKHLDHEIDFAAKIERTAQPTVNCFLNLPEEILRVDDLPLDDELLTNQSPKALIRSNTSRTEKLRHLTTHNFEVETDEMRNQFFTELYQTLLSTTKASYRHMYDAGSINRSVFEFLMASLCYQQEAVNGDLDNHRFLRSAFPDIHKQSQDSQAKESVEIGWCYIAYYLTSTRDSIINMIMGVIGKRSLLVDWWLLQRNVTILHAYAITLEEQIEELKCKQKSFVQGKQEIQELMEDLIDRMLDLLKTCRETTMRSLQEENPVMFKLYEHLLAARLLAVQQTEVLKELADNGAVGESEVADLIKDLTEPTMRSLLQYTPTHDALHKAGLTDCSMYSSFLDIVIRIACYFTLEPIN
jgi:hypothetical protein